MNNQLSQAAQDFVTASEGLLENWSTDFETWFEKIEQAMDEMQQSGEITYEEYLIIEEILGF